MKNERESLILQNMKLVKWGVRRTKCYPIEKDERYSIGCESLIKAIDTYNPKYNTRLSCYFFNIYLKKLADEVRRNKKHMGVISMDAVMHPTDECEHTLHDIISSNDMAVSDQVILTDEYKELWQAVDDLPSEQRKVIRMRYSSMGYISKRQLAKKLGKSRPWVISREMAALKRCREALSVKN